MRDRPRRHGAVYLAARDDDEYRTQVAIKLLHHGLEQVMARVADRFGGDGLRRAALLEDRLLPDEGASPTSASP